MWLEDLGQEVDGTSEGINRLIHAAGRIEAETDKIIKLSRAGFEFESGAKSLDRAVVVAMVAKPGTEIDIRLYVWIGVKLGLQWLWTGAGCSRGKAGAETHCQQQPGLEEHPTCRHVVGWHL